ncbi:MAG TPA: ABC-type transport auxiliary lipoprotein family protein [Rhizomicrobium sp.]|jgi:cholesterol transport system auxiliary component
MQIERRLFLIGASALSLSACGNLLGPPDAGSIYTVRPTFPPAPAQTEKVGWALAVMRPDASGGLDTDRIALIQADGTMDYFAKATYPDRLPATVQRALLDGFETSGRITGVAREQDALHTDYNLLTEVKDFEAKYNAPDAVPSVTVVLNAKLTTSHSRRIVNSFITTQTINATANSTAAVTQALSQALGAAVTAIVNWTLAMPAPAGPGQTADPSPGKPAEQLLHDTTQGTNRARDQAPR